MLLVLIIFELFFVSGQELGRDLTEPSCFQFTWPGATYDNLSINSFNCSRRDTVPCVKPFVITHDSTPPNVTALWHEGNRTAISCPLRAGFVCIKYTYVYNNAIANATYFCGKMIQDRYKMGTAIEGGCYIQKMGGYTIEACACKSHIGNIPCNNSPNLHQTIVQKIRIILIVSFMILF